MFENPYNEKLEQLRAGTLTELVVKRDDFLLFREAWIEQLDKNYFVGEAGLGGRIVYRYQKPEENNRSTVNLEK